MTYQSVLYVFLLLHGFLSVCGHHSLAQSHYAINGKLFVEDGSVAAARVVLLEGTTREMLAIDSKGAFQAKLAWGKIYFFHLSKPDYVSKIIEFSTVVPATTNRMAISPYELQVKLFKVFDGVDSMFFKQPVAKVFFDVRTSDFEYDTDYSLMIARRIEQMRKQVGNPKPQVKNTTVQPFAENNHLLQKELRKHSNEQSIESPSPTEIQVEAPQVTMTGSRKVLPPIKPFYAEGRTIEEYDLDNKKVTRVIVKSNKRQKILLKVKHNWGPTYYFFDESPLTIRCVSKNVFERETLLRSVDL